MNHFSKILAFILLFLGGGVLVATAQNYVPLAPLPGTAIDSSATTVNLSSYISGVIKLLIALGGGLAILFAVIGGVQYVAASINPSAKADALEKVQNAIIGLIIILSSYLLLNSINPKLVDFKLALPRVSPPVYVEPIVTGSVWGDDTSMRASLANTTIIADGTAIGVNKVNCSNINQQNCTSVFGLSAQSQSGLWDLTKNCVSQGIGKCQVIITGGTEWWLHKSHNDGTKVDISKGSDPVNKYIMKWPSSITSCGVSTDPHYQPPSGGIYVDEPDRDEAGNIISGGGRHWHICY
ncbi:MAG: hypothetical protein Q7K40_01780 [bacterium]|nr:hypothetical protein [bacterium]